MDDYIISFYNDKKEKKNYHITDIFDEGSNGYIYHLDNNTCLKLFGEFYINDKILKQLKTLKLPNFYEIYDLLYDKDNHFSGYTMKYYKKENIDIITKPIDYTLDNLYKVYTSLEILSKNNIFANDINSENIIMNNKDITIIDTDLFYDMDDPQELNYQALMYLFRELYYQSVKQLGYNSYDTDIIIQELFSPEDNIKNVEKRLVRHKYPIDYIKERLEG